MTIAKDHWNTRFHSGQASNYTVSAFHVGQGMCVLIYNTDLKYGFFIDAGAGTPIKRDAYQRGMIQNALATIVDSLTWLDIVISHADSDHWRLIAWDHDLRHKIHKILIAQHCTHIAFRDRSISDKIEIISDKTITLTESLIIKLYKSQPSKDDSNGRCLVTLIEFNGKKILCPGDYTYSRMLTDGNANINSIGAMKFDSIIVPHHGDLSSAQRIFHPKSNNISKAVFLAGNNRRYNHPRGESVEAHQTIKYSNVNDTNNTSANIIELKL